MSLTLLFAKKISDNKGYFFNLINSFSSNKLFFAKLILPDIKIKKTKNHKLLTPASFEDLGKMLSHY